jgi:hypothetical protein
MANVVKKIEFPRSSPDSLISMTETLLKTHDENPAAVNIDAAIITSTRTKVALAKQKREDAKNATDLAIKLRGEADMLLGIALGQSLEDDTTVAGGVAAFRDHAQLSYKQDIKKLKDYGFTVNVSQRAARITKAKVEKIKNLL